jgi:uncharacterized protein (TIGR02145 family)
MTRLHIAAAIALCALYATSASAQTVATWPLTQSTAGNSAAPALVTASPEVVAGTPAVQVFDYWAGQAQRLWAGTSGWIAGGVNTQRFIQFDAAPTPGNQLSVTGVSFNYGGAGINGHIRSQVRYSVDNWTTFTVLGTPLAYPNPAMLPFNQGFTAPPVTPGNKFSLRIYPYADVSSIGGSPTFASHNNVVIRGTSTPVAGDKVRFEIRKNTGAVAVPGTYWFTVMCAAPNGTPYAPVNNPVGIVLPGSGATMVSVAAGHFCNVTETVPTPGTWGTPVFTGTGVSVASSGWESKVGPINATGGVVTVSNRPGTTPPGDKVRFEIRKTTGAVAIPGTYWFTVMCNAPNGTVYAPVNNPVPIVLPGSGTAMVTVTAGHFCNVTETVPTTGTWGTPVFTGTGVAVASSGWESKVGPINATGSVVTVSNRPGTTPPGDKVRFEIRKNTGAVAVPGTYWFTVMCSAPNGTPYAPVNNPVGIVLPGSGATMVSVAAGHICSVTETVPTPGTWGTPVFTGTGVAVGSSGWQGKVGPINATGSVVTVSNRPGTTPPPDEKQVRFDIRKSTGDKVIDGTYLFNVSCSTPSGTTYSPNPNPVAVVLPSPGMNSVSVPVGSICIVKEVPPAGTWDPPTFTGNGMYVDMGAPWEAKVGPMTSGGGTVSVVNKPGSGTVAKMCPDYQFTDNVDLGNMIFSTVGGAPGAPLNVQGNNGTVEKYCYGNSAASCSTYGGLYEWGEAMRYFPSNNNDLTGARVQGICPAGSHIPSDLEWARYAFCQESAVAPTGPTPLATFQNQANFGWMGSTAAGVGPGHKMKKPFGSFAPAWTGSNASGFAALPAGSRTLSTGVFDSEGAMATFWSSTQGPSGTRAYHFVLDTVSSAGRSGRNLTPKAYGMSVRCMKDYP